MRGAIEAPNTRYKIKLEGAGGGLTPGVLRVNFIAEWREGARPQAITPIAVSPAVQDMPDRFDRAIARFPYDYSE